MNQDRGGGAGSMSQVERMDSVTDVTRLGNNESAGWRIDGTYPACSAVWSRLSGAHAYGLGGRLRPAAPSDLAGQE